MDGWDDDNLDDLGLDENESPLRSEVGGGVEMSVPINSIMKADSNSAMREEEVDDEVDDDHGDDDEDGGEGWSDEDDLDLESDDEGGQQQEEEQEEEQQEQDEDAGGEGWSDEDDLDLEDEEEQEDEEQQHEQEEQQQQQQPPPQQQQQQQPPTPSACERFYSVGTVTEQELSESNSSSEVATLNALLASKNDALAALTSEIDTLTSSAYASDAWMSNATESISELELEITSLRSQLNYNSNSNADSIHVDPKLIEEAENLKLNALKSDEWMRNAHESMKDLENENETLTSHLKVSQDILKTEKEVMGAEIAELTERLKTSKLNVEQLEADFNANSNANKKEIEALQKRVKEKEIECREKGKLIKEGRGKAGMLDAQLTEALGRSAELQTKQKESGEQLQVGVSKLEEVEAKNVESAAKVAELTEQLNATLASNASSDNDRDLKIKTLQAQAKVERVLKIDAVRERDELALMVQELEEVNESGMAELRGVIAEREEEAKKMHAEFVEEVATLNSQHEVEMREREKEFEEGLAVDMRENEGGNSSRNGQHNVANGGNEDEAVVRLRRQLQESERERAKLLLGLAEEREENAKNLQALARQVQEQLNAAF